MLLVALAALPRRWRRAAGRAGRAAARCALQLVARCRDPSNSSGLNGGGNGGG